MPRGNVKRGTRGGSREIGATLQQVGFGDAHILERDLSALDHLECNLVLDLLEPERLKDVAELVDLAGGATVSGGWLRQFRWAGLGNLVA
jgi:hypothetical protein